MRPLQELMVGSHGRYPRRDGTELTGPPRIELPAFILVQRGRNLSIQGLFDLWVIEEE